MLGLIPVLAASPAPMFASIEGAIITILIVAGGAVFNWLRGKSADSDWGDLEKPRPTANPPPRHPSSPPANSWEEELRRALEGNNPRPAAPPPLPAPPPRRAPAPTPPPQRRPASTPPPRPAVAKRPAPTPPPVSRPSTTHVFNETKIYRAHCAHCGGHIQFPSPLMGDTVPCPHCHRPTELQPFSPTRVEQLSHQRELYSFKESTAAHQKASHLTAHVAETARSDRSSAVSARQRRSMAAEQVVSNLRRPDTARQAIIAALVLSPPKALEQS